jgi:hypothetical protein
MTHVQINASKSSQVIHIHEPICAARARKLIGDNQNIFCVVLSSVCSLTAGVYEYESRPYYDKIRLILFIMKCHLYRK